MGSNGSKERNKKLYEGNIYSTNNCGDLKIIEYRTHKDVIVEFVNTSYTTSTRLGEILNGKVRDRSLPFACGVGYLGDAPTKHEGKLRREYHIWANMLRRCYGKENTTRSPTYVGCTVSDNFKSYEYFYNWCQDQIGFDNIDFHLDKDLLIKGNKLYSEDTCVFVPREINNLFTKRQNDRGKYPIGVTVDKRGGRYFAQLNVGKERRKFGYSDTPEEAFLAYKQAKEAYIKEVANKWRDQIDSRVYEALMNYQVEITD